MSDLSDDRDFHRRQMWAAHHADVRHKALTLAINDMVPQKWTERVEGTLRRAAIYEAYLNDGLLAALPEVAIVVARERERKMDQDWNKQTFGSVLPQNSEALRQTQSQQNIDRMVGQANAAQALDGEARLRGFSNAMPTGVVGAGGLLPSDVLAKERNDIIDEARVRLNKQKQP